MLKYTSPYKMILGNEFKKNLPFCNEDVEVEEFFQTETGLVSYLCKFAAKINENENNLGVLFTKDSVQASIILGKMSGIRACLCHNQYLSGMSRVHNNANVLILGLDFLGLPIAKSFIPGFMTNCLLYNEQKKGHKRRVEKIKMVEQLGENYSKKTN